MGTISIVRVAVSCLAVMGSASVFCKVAQVLAVEENAELAQLFNRSRQVGAAKWIDGEVREKTLQMCSQDKVQSAPDMYRVATILSKSDKVSDLLLAHDFALASVLSGFRPGMKIIDLSQEALLKSFNVQEKSELMPSGASSGSTRVTRTMPGAVQQKGA